MRRKDREITDLQAKLAILDECKVCRIALSDNNTPYIVPLNYGYRYENGTLTLYFHGALEGKKIDIMRNNNQACFEVDCGHDLIVDKVAWNYSYAYRSVIGFGTIVFIEDEQEKAYGLNQLLKHQNGKWTEYEYGKEMLQRVCVYKMEVEEFTGKEHNRLPDMSAAPNLGSASVDNAKI